MTSTYDRRQFLSHSAAAAGGVVATGALVDQIAAGPAGAVTPGGTLKVGVVSEQHKPLTPGYANLDTSGFVYARAVYDPLCIVGADGKTVYPYLAKSITHDATYKKWTITARPGVKFHDGTPCDGDAIYANMLAVYNSALTGKAVKALILGYSHTPGSATVTINTRYKWTTLPFTMAEQQISFIAKPSTTGPTYNGNPIGTGPFEFSQWIYNTKFVCTKNTNYWRAGLPYLNQLEIYPIPDATTRVNSLKAGNLDIIHDSDPITVKGFGSLGGGYQTWSDASTAVKYSRSSNCMMMNVKKAPFTDKYFRKACATAIDRATFAHVIGAGIAKPVDGIFQPGSPYYKKPPYPAFSVAAAKTTMKSSKIAPANRKFTLTCVNSPQVEASATLIQTFLAKIGVTVTINPVSQATLIGSAIFGTYQAMTWSQFGGVSPDLDYPWFSTKSGLNFAQNMDTKIEAAMVAGLGATTQTARVTYWSKVNTLIDTDIPYAWTDTAVWAFAAKANVQNWKTFTEPGGKPALQPNGGALFFTSTWKS